MTGGRWKRLLFGVLAILMSSIVALVFVEGFLRVAGRLPWRPIVADTRQPAMHDPDPVLGWRPRPGRYEYPAYAASEPDIHVTILADGTRATGHHNETDGPDVAFVGCSFTQGWGISDDETFAWLIQDRFPSVRMANYGTGAYGTYQSLLVMERLLHAGNQPRIFVYGFIEQHETRNVAATVWLNTLALASKAGMVATPYCTLDAHEALVRHAPRAYPQWPLRTRLASVRLLETFYAYATGAARDSQARAVTDQLLLEMDRETRAAGVRFLVAILSATDEGKAHYVSLFRAHDIDAVDCVFPLTREFQVPWEGHPNGDANARFATCIGERLAQLIPPQGNTRDPEPR